MADASTAPTVHYDEAEREYVFKYDFCGQFHLRKRTVGEMYTTIVCRRMSGDWPAHVAQQALNALEGVCSVNGRGWRAAHA